MSDVGFGGHWFDEPIRLVPDAEQVRAGRAYRIVARDDRLVAQAREAGGGWYDAYAFTLQPRELADFAEQCLRLQTDPESSFVKGRLCSLARPNGTVTLAERRVIVTENGERREWDLLEDEDWAAAVRNLFGMDPTA